MLSLDELKKKGYVGSDAAVSLSHMHCNPELILSFCAGAVFENENM